MRLREISITFLSQQANFESMSHCETKWQTTQLIENKWRKRVGVEPTSDRIAYHPQVLKIT